MLADCHFPGSVIACPSYICLRGHPLPHRCLSRVIRFERQVKGTKSTKFDWLSWHLHLNADFHLCFIYVRFVGAPLPPSLELLHPLFIHTEITGLLHPYTVPAVGSLIKDELSCSNLYIKLKQTQLTPPSSRKQSSFCIFMRETNKTEARHRKCVCLSPTLSSSGFPLVPSTDLWKFGLSCRHFSVLSE